ncbi:U3 small nucleolar RNA-associated protein 11 [Golovinomyces cichoracearum]|uniref:U3 small nucleolar RNA-associated protein 11 n=1 Tax=Golovinomyces cichoracearum TaxID=62708 RepID=A0A420IVJ6_9PEZI|nr:U3 small nucleolar RNA-associated protein 11 [Golovinomyces cichoracearum]
MSSMRNAVQRRVHRERGQIEERKKWGLLEKHKDYSARARDYNAKKAKLKALRQKVLEKNPDEFYFGMMSRTGPSSGKGQTGTVAGDRGNKVLSQDTVRLLKTQDLAYIRTSRNKATKEVSRLEMAVKGIVGEGKKVVYITDQSNDLDQKEESCEQDDIDEKNLTKGDGDSLSLDQKRRKIQRREAEKLKVRLEMARKRLKALADAEEELEIQRAKMSKSPTVGGVNKNGIKYRVRDRKR